MHAADAHAAFCPSVDFREPLAALLKHLVFPSAVHIEDHRIRALENALIRRPAVEHVFHLQFRRALRQTFREKLHACVELMHARRMRWLARDKDELLLAVRGSGAGGKWSERESDK